MITKINDRSGGIIKSPASNDLVYLNEISLEYDFIQNIIHTHIRMARHVNNSIKKLLFHKVIK